MGDVHRCMIVEADIVELVRVLAVQVAGEGAVGMWVTGLSPTGALPPTHYVSSGMIDEEFAAMLDDPALLAAAAGIELADAQEILSKTDISSEDPYVAFDRLGLQLAEEPYFEPEEPEEDE